MEKKKYDTPLEFDPVVEGESLYTCTNIKDSFVNKWQKTSEGSYPTDEKLPATMFVFRRENSKNWIWVRYNNGVSDRCGLFKFLQQCYNSLLLKEIRWRTGKYDNGVEWKVCEPESRFRTLAQQLIGQKFKIDVILKDGKYTKIKSITPMNTILVEPAAEPTAPVQDDIPFGHAIKLDDDVPDWI